MKFKNYAEARAAWDRAANRTPDERRHVAAAAEATFDALKARNNELLANGEAQMRASDQREFESNLDELTKLGALIDEWRKPEPYPAPFAGGGIRDRTAGGPFAAAVLAAGFDLRRTPTVEIDAFTTLRNSSFDDPDYWAPSSPRIVPQGQDRRFLWSNLISEPAENSAIQDFRQTGRTLTGTVQRALDATTDKAELDVVTELVTEQLVEFAVTIDDIPNAVLEFVPSLTAFLNNEARFQIDKAIDEHVMARILAAGPPNHLSGTGLIAQVRHGIAAHRAAGAAPTLLVVNPLDAAELDLSTTGADDALVFATRATGTSSPLWGQTVIERAGAGDEVPMLIDRQMLGVLYLGTMRLDFDPYTAFKKNLTTLRVEVKGLMHVRNANGALLIEADED